jgi:hypothetical protein
MGYDKELRQMSITIELAPELQAELVRQAARRGVGVDTYAASLIESAAGFSKGPAPVAGNPQASAASPEVVAAIEALRGFGKTHGLSVGGMTIRELRHEARP